MKSKTIIKLEDMKKYFYLANGDEIKVLNGIDLEIKAGEFVALMGESGSGKSTILNVIACLFPLTKGKYILDDEDISNLQDDEILSFIRNKKMGFVFQQFHLISEYTALENVALAGVFGGVSKVNRIEKAKELLEKLGLKNKLKSKPPELSGGEKQRVAIARALINDPEILIADEPTGSLDSKNSIEIMELLKTLHKKGRTIIMVTHSRETAEFADRIIYLKDGKIVNKK
ncbi:MAG: ABC transporter ATP-binding protein [Candidatus Gracilibacteria bacterium]